MSTNYRRKHGVTENHYSSNIRVNVHLLKKLSVNNNTRNDWLMDEWFLEKLCIHREEHMFFDFLAHIAVESGAPVSRWWFLLILSLAGSRTIQRSDVVSWFLLVALLGSCHTAPK